MVLHHYLKASLPVIVHKLEDDGLRSRLCLASGLVHLEAPEILPLKLGEGMHHDGGKREIEQSSKVEYITICILAMCSWACFAQNRFFLLVEITKFFFVKT